MVLGRSAWTLTVGLTIGVAGALSVTRLMGSLLFGIGPADPLTPFGDGGDFAGGCPDCQLRPCAAGG
jgi:hypothetical protein